MIVWTSPNPRKWHTSAKLSNMALPETWLKVCHAQESSTMKQFLENRCNKPRLIHQAHVKEIIEVPSLRDNSAKEIRCLHDVLQQHLCALKAMKKEPSSPFITSLIEMKLDNDTRFECQKHSQASDDMPDYNDLLKFLNLRAQAAESPMSGPRHHGNNRKGQTPNLPGREFSHLTHAQDQVQVIVWYAMKSTHCMPAKYSKISLTTR